MRILVDDVDLDDSGRRWFLDFSALLPAVAARDVAKLRLPSRSGVTVRKLSWGESTLKVAVNVPPQKAFGVQPVLPVEERTLLLRSILARAGSVTVTSDGRTLSNEVVEVDVSDPVRVGVEAWRVGASLTLQPFWREVNTLTSPVVSPGSVVFAPWASSTGDVQDGILRIKGPLTKCSITGRGGVSFDRSLTAAQYVYIDVAAFRAWYSTSASAWTPTSTAVLLDYPAAGPLVLEPSAAGIALSFTGDGFVTSGTAAETTGITLRGGRYWL